MIFSAALTAALLVFLLRSLIRGWREAGIYSWSLEPAPLVAAFVVAAAYFALAAWAWKRVLAALGEEIPFRESCRIWFLSQLGKYIPGKVWFAMGRIVLAGRAGVGAGAASVSTVVELMMVLLASALVFLASLPARPGPAGREMVFALGGAVILVLLLHPRVFGFLLRLAARVLGRQALPYRIGWRGLASLTLLYGASWILYGAGLVLLSRAIRLEGAPPPPPVGEPARLLVFSGAAAISWALGFLSVLTPSGLGVREAALGYLLGSTLPPPGPVVLALAARLWITLAEMGAAAIGWFLGRTLDERKEKA
ncbi:MAG: flippase-like domain-containing protein [Candidatus Eisenbacteria bacterium]|nr:flippase-like domain-containing protein [Candidatus Eisenbacteria bacterium]